MRRHQFIAVCGFSIAWLQGAPRTQGGEARVIAASGGVASRRGDTLVIRVQGQSALRLVNRPSTPQSALEFTYAGRIPATAYHVVNVHYWETGDVLVIDADSGDTVHMAARPIVSPSGRLAVATVYDMTGIGESLNSVELWQMKPRPARVVWRVDMAPPDTIGKWGVSVDGWSGDSIVRLTRHIVIAGKANARGDQPERRAGARLLRFGATWRLDTLSR